MRRLICLILLLIMLIGCGNSGEEATQSADIPPTATPAPVATENVAPTPTNTLPAAVVTTTEAADDGEETLADVAVANDFTELDSYQFTAEYVIVDGDSAENLQRIDVRWQYAGDDQRFDLNTRGVDAQAVTMVVQGAQAYMVLEGLGCSTMPVANANVTQFAEIVNTEQFTERLGDARRIRPNEMINGVEAAHYQFDSTALSLQSGGIGTRATGDIYLDAVTNRLVRLVIEGSDPQAFGMNDAQFTSDDTFSIVYNVTDVGVPIDILVPDSCTNSAETPSYPQLPDAYDMTTMNNMVFYYTLETPEQAVAFYQESLATEGWVYVDTDSTLSPQTNLLSFTRDDESLTIIISPVADQDATTVTIMGE